MKRSFIILMLITGCFSITAKVFAAEGYISGILSNISQSHSAEAMQDLSALKANLLGCLEAHQGNESSCHNISSFAPSQNFNYSFVQLPKDSSKAWSLRAEGNGASGLSDRDQITLTSDDNGSVSCKGAGQLSGSC